MGDDKQAEALEVPTELLERLIREIELLHAAADRQDMYARGLIRRLQKFTGSSDP